MIQMNRTKYCIICAKNPATRFTGHVLKVHAACNTEKVIAGFCEDHEHFINLNIFNESGCAGWYDEKFGIQKYKF
jgi:hypothetical protein